MLIVWRESQTSCQVTTSPSPSNHASAHLATSIMSTEPSFSTASAPGIIFSTPDTCPSNDPIPTNPVAFRPSWSLPALLPATEGGTSCMMTSLDSSMLQDSCTRPTRSTYCCDWMTVSTWLRSRHVLHCAVYVNAQITSSGRVWMANSQTSDTLLTWMPDNDMGQMGLSFSASNLFARSILVGSSHQLSQWS